jgi:hypothetical protein
VSSDGGKGSSRRKENAQAVRDNWDRIFGNKKDTPMIDEEDNEDYTDDIDDGDEDCSWCGGCGEGDYDGASCRRCHGTGVEPNRERDCDDDY